MNRDTLLNPGATEIQKHPKWSTAVGILLIICGAVAIIAAFAATLATVLFFGVLLLIAGASQIIHALSAARWRGFVIYLIGGLLYAVVGGLIVIDPVAGAIGLTLLLGIYFVVIGALKIGLGFQAESGWITFSGFVDLLLGGLIWIGWPETGTWVIGLFVGIELVFAGLSLVAMGSATRSPAQMDPLSVSSGQHAHDRGV